MAHSEEKTESPTEFKLRQARQKGQVAKSADINTVLSLALVILFFAWFFPSLIKKINIFFKSLHEANFNSISGILIIHQLVNAVDLWFFISLPLLVAAALGAFLGNVGQIGFLLTSEPIKPDIKKLNFIKGFKKIFSKDRFVEFIKQVIKFCAILYVIYQAINKSLANISLMFRLELNNSLILIANIVSDIIIQVLLCFTVIAFFDVLWQRHSFLKSMRMSKYEVKKEYKQQEGDPHIKQERRRMHQELQESTAVKDVAKAAVVITNPRHIAVAIKYIDGIDVVPMLIAKGVGERAKELIQEANRRSVPTIRNVPLARDLQWLEINEEIPEQLYDSVAEVLIFIHELNNNYKKLDNQKESIYEDTKL